MSPPSPYISENTLYSLEGVQQGDPFGPLLFSLTLSDALSSSKCTLAAGYLNDVVLGDSIDVLIAEIKSFEARARTVGLSLNHSKCEIIGLNSHSRSTWTASGLHFEECKNESAVLLGSPLFTDGMEKVLQAKSDELTFTTSRLRHLSFHEAFCLLRGSLSLPRWLHIFRSSPCFRSPLLSTLNSTLRDSVSTLININLSDYAWSQCALPVR